MGPFLLTTLPMTVHSYCRDLSVPPRSLIYWCYCYLIIPHLPHVLIPYPSWISRSITIISPLHIISIFLFTFLACTGSANLQSWLNLTFHLIPCLCYNGAKENTQPCWLVSLWIHGREPQEGCWDHTVYSESILLRRQFHIFSFCLKDFIFE